MIIRVVQSISVSHPLSLSHLLACLLGVWGSEGGHLRFLSFFLQGLGVSVANPQAFGPPHHLRSVSLSRAVRLSLSFFRQGYGQKGFPPASLSLSLSLCLSVCLSHSLQDLNSRKSFLFTRGAGAAPSHAAGPLRAYNPPNT